MLILLFIAFTLYAFWCALDRYGEHCYRRAALAFRLAEISRCYGT